MFFRHNSAWPACVIVVPLYPHPQYSLAERYYICSRRYRTGEVCWKCALREPVSEDYSATPRAKWTTQQQQQQQHLVVLQRCSLLLRSVKIRIVHGDNVVDMRAVRLHQFPQKVNGFKTDRISTANALFSMQASGGELVSGMSPRNFLEALLERAYAGPATAWRLSMRNSLPMSLDQLLSTNAATWCGTVLKMPAAARGGPLSSSFAAATPVVGDNPRET